MAQTTGRKTSLQTVQLILRGKSPISLVSAPEDWIALGDAATRMLFWCGGAIYGCRCEGNEIRFAIQRGNAAIGVMAHHLSAVYSAYLRRNRYLKGKVFKHYLALPLADEIYLDDLVLWLHRQALQGHVHSYRLNTTRVTQTETIAPDLRTGPALWTADAAYLDPPSLPWVETAPVYKAMSPTAAPIALYRKRKNEPISAITLAAMMRRKSSAAPELISALPYQVPRFPLEFIIRVVAAHCRVRVADMHSDSRKRDVSKAKVIATVICTRNGGSVASAARLFRRSRSTLIERAEYYRQTQPELFSQAEAAFNASVEQREHESPPIAEFA